MSPAVRVDAAEDFGWTPGDAKSVSQLDAEQFVLAEAVSGPSFYVSSTVGGIERLIANA